MPTMPTSNTPPQLQLSLGHQTFKRSFQQFGLDVDEADETDGGSSSSRSSRSASTNDNAGGSSQSGSSSYTSSQGSTGDSTYGHNERNKRARSEGPEGARFGGASGSGSGAQPAALEDRAVLGGSGTGLGAMADTVAGPSLHAESTSHAQPDLATARYDYLSDRGSTFTNTPISSWPAPTLPMPSFGPPTPTIADFAAERERSRSRSVSGATASTISASSASSLEETIAPPGFSGMLSPRSSSPMPPPAIEIDVAMVDSEGGASDHRLSSIERSTDNLRESVARARAFDRSIAPLRVGTALENAGRVSRTTSRDTFRPHIPPFDFEAFRRRSSMAQPLATTFNDANLLSTPARPPSPGHGGRSLHTASSFSSLSNGSSASFSFTMPMPGLFDHSRPAESGPSYAARSPGVRAQSSSASTRRLPEDLEPMRFRRGLSSDDDEDEVWTDDANESGQDRDATSYIPDVPRSGPSLLEMPGLLRDVEEAHDYPNPFASQIADTNSALNLHRSGDSWSNIWAYRPLQNHHAQFEHRPNHEREFPTSSATRSQPQRIEHARRSPPLSLRPGYRAPAGAISRRSPQTIPRINTAPPNANTLSNSDTTRFFSMIGTAPDTFYPYESGARDENMESMVRFDLEMDADNVRRARAPGDGRSRTASRPWESQTRTSNTNLPTLRSAILNSEGIEDDEGPPAHDLQEILDRVRRVREEGSRRTEDDRLTSSSHRLGRDPAEVRRDPEVRLERESRMRVHQLPRLQESSTEAIWPLLVPSDPSPDSSRLPHTVEESPRGESTDDIISRLWDDDSPPRTEFGIGTSPLSQLMALPPLDLSLTPSRVRTPWHEEPRTRSPLRAMDDLRRPSPAGHTSLPQFARSGIEEPPIVLGQSLLNQLLSNEDDDEIDSLEEHYGPTMLQELRERHRLPIRRRTLLDRISSPATERQELNSQSASSISRWRHSFQPTPAAPQLSLDMDMRFPDQLSRNTWLDIQSTSENIESSNAARSSSEAAAYFASGSGLGSSNQSDNLRRRHSTAISSDLFNPLDGDRSSGAARTRHSLYEELSSLPESNTNRSPLERLQSERRALASAHSSDMDQTHNRAGSDSLNFYGYHRTSGFLPRQAPSRTNSGDSSTSLLRAARTRPSTMLETSTSSRSRPWIQNSAPPNNPPSLPPLQFDQSSLVSDQQSASESLDVHNSMWRRAGAMTGRTRPAHLPSEDSHTRLPSDGSTAYASQMMADRAMLIDNMRMPLSAEREPSSISSASASSSRARPGPVWRIHSGQDFQQAMNVLEGDGLPAHRRQQFTNAYERERERNIERDRARLFGTRRDIPPPPPRDRAVHTQERWGELLDSSESPNSWRSPGSWADQMRRRRGSMSALFAPPPDNADNAPPNRGRPGSLGAHGHHHGGMYDAFDAGAGLGFGLAGSGESTNGAGTGAGSGRTVGSAARRFFRERANSVRSLAFRPSRNRMGSLRNMGDFIRDEDFDTSYESLLALSATLGEVKPKATPTNMIAALPTGLYKEWQTLEGDKRCPICLEDYKAADAVQKAEPCNHWLHKECLEQWLHSARTCPVCRTTVEPPSASASSSDSSSPTSTSASGFGMRSPPPIAGPSRFSLSNVGSSGAANSSTSGATSGSSNPLTRSRAHTRARSLSRAIRPLLLFSEDDESGF